MRLKINQAIQAIISANARLNELRSTKQSSLTITKERSWFGVEKASTKEKEPTYDPIDLDDKICLLGRLLENLNSAVKQSDALTEIEVEGDKEIIYTSIKPYISK